MLLVLLLCSVFLEGTWASESALDLRVKGDGMMKAGQVKQAVNFFGQAIDAEPGNHINWYKRSLAHSVSGHIKGAINDLSEALKIKGDFIQALQNRGKLHLQVGAFSKAKQDYEGAFAVNPEQKTRDMITKATTAESQANHGKQRFEAKDWNGALSLLSAAIEAAPKGASLRLLRAKVYLQLGDVDKAIGDAERAAKFQKEDLSAVAILSHLYYEKGEADKSLERLRSCLQSDQDYKECRDLYNKVKKFTKSLNKGNEAFNQGRYEEAVTKYRKCLDIETATRYYLVHLNTKICDAYLKAEQGEEAKAACGVALAIDGNHMDALLKRAEAHQKLGEFEEAVRDYQMAHQREPNNQNINQKLQQAQRQLKQAQRKNYYKILGVARNAKSKDIKKAYRKLAAANHPDKFPEGPEREEALKRYHDAGEAMEVLSDDDKRRRYDNGEDVDAPQQSHHHGFPQNFNFHFRQG